MKQDLSEPLLDKNNSALKSYFNRAKIKISEEPIENKEKDLMIKKYEQSLIFLSNLNFKKISLFLLGKAGNSGDTGNDSVKESYYKLKLCLLAKRGMYEELGMELYKKSIIFEANLKNENTLQVKLDESSDFHIIYMNDTKELLVLSKDLKYYYGIDLKNGKWIIAEFLPASDLLSNNNKAGASPLIFAILGEKQKNATLKITSIMLFCCILKYNPLNNSITINEAQPGIEKELGDIYNYFNSISALMLIIEKDDADQLRYIFDSQGFKLFMIGEESILLYSLNKRKIECVQCIISCIQNIFQDTEKKENDKEIDKKNEEKVEEIDKKNEEKVKEIINQEKVKTRNEVIVIIYHEIDKYLKIGAQEIINILSSFYNNMLSLLTLNQKLMLAISNDYSDHLLPIINFEESYEESCKELKSITNADTEYGNIARNRIGEESILLYSINKKAIKCTNHLFSYILKILKESIQNPRENQKIKELRDYLLKMIQDELESYLKINSNYLKELLILVFEENSELLQDDPDNLPKCSMIKDPNEFDNFLKSTTSEHIDIINVKTYNSLIKLPGTIGSKKSVEFLKSIESSENLQIFKTQIIKYYIQYKWNAIWPIILFRDLLVLANIPLIFIISFVDQRNNILYEDPYSFFSFIIINVILTILEIVQFISLDFLDYFGFDFSDFNIIDIVALLRVIILSIQMISKLFLIKGVYDFLGFDLICSGLFAILSVIFIKFIKNFEVYSRKFLFCLIIMSFPAFVCAFTWIDNDIMIIISGGAAILGFILLNIFGNHKKYFYLNRMIFSGTQLVLSFINLCIGRFDFSSFMIFLSTSLGILISDIIMMIFMKDRIDYHSQYDSQQLIFGVLVPLTLTLNLLFEGISYIRTLIFILCLIDLILDIKSYRKKHLMIFPIKISDNKSDQIKVNSKDQSKPEVQQTSEDQSKPKVQQTSEDQSKPQVQQTSEDQSKPQVQQTSKDQSKPEVQQTSEDQSKPQVQQKSKDQSKPEVQQTSEDQQSPDPQRQLKSEDQNKTEDNSNPERQQTLEVQKEHEEQVELWVSYFTLYLITLNPSNSRIQMIFILTFTSFHFINLNSKKVLNSKKILQIFKQFVSNWNSFDIIRIVLSFIWIYNVYFKIESEILVFCLAFVTFIRGLTAFRAFDGTRHYIRLILNSMRDISSFMIIFFYSTLCFGIITGISKNSDDYQKVWIDSYYLNLGEFKYSNEKFDLNYITFVAATVLNIIIMLNLLVSILADSFDKFQTSSKQIDYMEMISVILEVESMMFFRSKAQDDGYFLVACEPEYQVKHEWDGKILIVQKQLDELHEKMKNSSKKLEDHFNYTNAELLSLKKK